MSKNNNGQYVDLNNTPVISDAPSFAMKVHRI